MRRGGHGGADRGPYFVVLRLYNGAVQDWRWFLGYCLNKGIGDPRDMYVDQLCALVWFLMVQEKEPSQVEYMKAQLWIPPKGVEVDERSPWHPKNQVSQLQRVKGGTPAREGAKMPASRDVPPPRPIPGTGGAR